MTKKIKHLIKLIFVACVFYILSYVFDSYFGGYWLKPEMDGSVRYVPNAGGFALPVSIMWQPRYGHDSVGHTDLLGWIYAPLILLDRNFIHPTKNMVLDEQGTWKWLHHTSSDQIHPFFRKEFEDWKKNSLTNNVEHLRESPEQ